MRKAATPPTVHCKALSGFVEEKTVVGWATNILNGVFRGSRFVHDKTVAGWTLVEDTDFVGDEELELGEFLDEGEEYVGGYVMFERSKKKPRAGQRHAEFLLAHQKDIPREWTDCYPVFTGTVWREPFKYSFVPVGDPVPERYEHLFGRNPVGYMFVPVLNWGGREWKLDFQWLGSVRWDSGPRLVRPRK